MDADCECQQTDVDTWSARECPIHGEYSPMARLILERDAEAEVRWAERMEGLAE